ncbi:transposase InsO family protein [Saccharopolyspora lacisalsi]|uniref:Transposase InsO family protein n=1 Tax=Halosaccharopolyspora lacisalsi TaxID=1000566 RepID=A0A839DXB7_9PSEU|nr:transposase InsO family protein [Halosaccharopolyspora lacisalsi]
MHADSGGTYGSPRVHAQLRREGRVVNHKRVERLMREYDLVGVNPRKRVRTTVADQPEPAPDLLGRDFTPGLPDQRWAGDITYIPTDEGWLYLAAVLDVGSRPVLVVGPSTGLILSVPDQEGPPVTGQPLLARAKVTAVPAIQASGTTKSRIPVRDHPVIESRQNNSAS